MDDSTEETSLLFNTAVKSIVIGRKLAGYQCPLFMNWFNYIYSPGIVSNKRVNIGSTFSLDALKYSFNIVGPFHMLYC